MSLTIVTSTCSMGLSDVCLLLLSPQHVPWACLLCVSYCCHLNVCHRPVCCVSLTVVTSTCSIGLSVVCCLSLAVVTSTCSMGLLMCLLCVSYCCHLKMFHGPVCCVSLTVVTSTCSMGLSVACLLLLSPQRVPWACLMCVSCRHHLNVFHGPVCCVSLTVVTSTCSIGLMVCLLCVSCRRHLNLLHLIHYAAGTMLNLINRWLTSHRAYLQQNICVFKKSTLYLNHPLTVLDVGLR